MAIPHFVYDVEIKATSRLVLASGNYIPQVESATVLIPGPRLDKVGTACGRPVVHIYEVR